MSTHADTGAALAPLVGARELAAEVAALIGRENARAAFGRAAGCRDPERAGVVDRGRGSRRAYSPRPSRALCAFQR